MKCGKKKYSKNHITEKYENNNQTKEMRKERQITMSQIEDQKAFGKINQKGHFFVFFVRSRKRRGKKKTKIFYGEEKKPGGKKMT